MRTSSLFASALAAVTCVVAQNAAAVIQDIYAFGNGSILLNSDVQQVNNSVQGLPWALQTQVDAVNIYRQVKNATLAAQSSANFTEDESFAVAITLVNVTSYVKMSLANSSSKASSFEGLAPLVLGSLYQLKGAADIFANATIAKLTATYQGVAPGVKGDLDTAFNNAIVAYGGKPLAG